MRAPLAAMAALAGGLLFLPAVQGPASSAPIDLKSLGSASGSVILVGHGGGGGGGGGFSVGGGGGGGGGGHIGGGGGFSGGGHIGGIGGGGHVGRIGGGNFVSRGGGGNFAVRSGHMNGGPKFADNGSVRAYSSRAYSGPRYTNRDLSHGGPRGDVRHGNPQAYNRDRGHDHGDRNRRFAERHDHDHDFDHNGRHRVFRNGVWVWVYGPDYYAYGDNCYWLRQQAYRTGSPYWWSRYNTCVSSYY
jgi:hypothetical protein